MKITPSFLIPFIASTFVAPASAWWKGFNLKSNRADGTTCKAKADWLHDFTSITSFPNGINAARLFYSHRCDTLANAVPEAIKSGTYILVGLDDSESQFSLEKGALKSAIEQHGWNWLVGISVGSESLYRGATDASSLSAKIRDVRGMIESISGYSSRIEVGHVDTTNAWFDEANTAVIQACDFIGVDIYPYFQTQDNNHIKNAKTLFDNAMAQMKTAVSNAQSHASVWVTETGWPVDGPASGSAVPSVENAASYFQQVACPSFSSMNTFWFTFQDWYASPSFAVVGPAGQEYFSQSC